MNPPPQHTTFSNSGVNIGGVLKVNVMFTVFVYLKLNPNEENQSTLVLIRSLCTQQCLIGCVFCPELSLQDTAKAVGQTSTGSICDAGQEGEAKH